MRSDDELRRAAKLHHYAHQIQRAFHVRRVVFAERMAPACDVLVGTRRGDDPLVTWLGRGSLLHLAVEDAFVRAGAMPPEGEP
jgi:hypothetical protein